MAEHPEFRSVSNSRDKPVVMTTPVVIAHLSDPHLTTPVPGPLPRLGMKRLLSYLSWRRKRRHRHQQGILAAVVDDLRAGAPDHLLVTGDLTHLGLPGECREALAWLRRLGEPAGVSVVPGNHDCLVAADWASSAGLWRDFFASGPAPCPAAGTVPRPDAGSARDAPFPMLRRCGRVALVGLNTAVPTRPLLASGRLGAVQRERLGTLLETLGREGLFRLVFLHHSPLPDGHAWRKRLRDAGALLEVLRATGAELVVHGHGHHEALATVATSAGPMVVVGAPSASLTGDFQAGWNRYLIGPARDGWLVTVELHRHGPAGMVLHDSSIHTLPRPA